MSEKVHAKARCRRPDVRLLRVNSHYEPGFCCILKCQPPVAGPYFEDARITKIHRPENCAGHDASRIHLSCHDGHTTTLPEEPASSGSKRIICVAS